MKHYYQKPHPSLSEYVRTVLILESSLQPDPDHLPLVTNGMPALICKTERVHSENENLLQLTLFGNSASSASWEMNENTTVIAYFFKPFVLGSLFSIPAAKLAKTAVDLSNWNPIKTTALKTQLIYAGSTSRKVEVLDNLLIQQLQQNKNECGIIRYATDQMMYNSGTEVLADLLNKINMSQRTFQRMFKKYVGVTPTQYRRICQFQLAFTQLRSEKFDTLTDIAYEHGFADQSHFIRSFREFAKTTPNRYLRFGLKK
jgi:AraC-like DNA-binding protein